MNEGLDMSLYTLPPGGIRPRVQPRSQRGATTLIVVMVLFFVAALAAAYASRNLIFEQRTSANQYRSTQSFEAAEAGLEWALALLNSGRIDANCQPTADTGFDSFRQRHLTVDSTTGQVTPRFNGGGGFMWAACVWNGTDWTCSCPNSAQNLASLSTGPVAFGVRFEYESVRPGMTRIEVNGCNGYDLTCLTSEVTTLAPNCNATLCSLAMLAKGIKAVPVAAVTALGTVGPGPLTITNTDLRSDALTVHSRSLDNAALALQTSPGSPPADSVRSGPSEFPGVVNDSVDCVADRTCLTMFQATFGTTRATYRDQPGIVRLDCAGGCTVSQVNAALAQQRGRMVWLSGAAGGLTISSSSAVIGSAADPVVLIIEGTLNMEAGATASATSRARVFGLVYAGNATVSGGRIDGALISDGSVSGSGGALPGEIVYDRDVLNRLHHTQGSFVRVPGSWRDFQ